MRIRGGETTQEPFMGPRLRWKSEHMLSIEDKDENQEWKMGQ